MLVDVRRSVVCVSVLVMVAGACASNTPTSNAPVTTPAPVNLEPAPEATATTPPPATVAPTTSEPVEQASEGSGASTSSTAPSSTSTTTSTTTTTTTLPPDPLPPNEQFSGTPLALELVAEVDKPTGVTWKDGDDAMYVSTQAGPILRVTPDATELVLDLTAETFEALPGSERGVLGVAFDPRDGRMFVNYTDIDHDTRVVSFELVDGVAVPESRREVLFIDQPGLGHNGGRLLFDAAGNLYVASGDGGASSGRDVEDTTLLLGTILRVTPRLDGDGYDIPPDNPHADGVNDRPEVLARGFRNPWTFSIDDDTGDIWIGDVGNNSFEEVSRMRPDQWGGNFGWPFYEGNDRRRSGAPDGVIAPVYAYGRSEGTAVMGGHVYRGDAIPELRGAYLFGDLTGPVWAIGTEGVSRLAVDRVNTMVGWAEDPDGELYVLSLRDGVFRLVPASP